jgi:hypothetical protein
MISYRKKKCIKKIHKTNNFLKMSYEAHVIFNFYFLVLTKQRIREFHDEKKSWPLLPNASPD